MARYKDYNYDQMKMIPVSYEKQILPGSFEYSLSYLIDNELNLSALDQYYRNDDNGRPAYDPRLLLKIVILACSKGITSSRQIERLCRENIFSWRCLQTCSLITVRWLILYPAHPIR